MVYKKKNIIVCTISLLKSVCRTSHFLLDRLGRYLKLFVSTVGPSSHEFGIANFL